MSRLMKRSLAVILALGAACAEPPKSGQMELIVRGLADIHTWDPVMEAEGHYAYNGVRNSVPDILPILAAHLTDETPTALYERIVDRRPTVSDLCILLLLKYTGIDKKEFLKDGLFISTALENPVFCVKWDPGARQRVQKRFFEILPPPD